MDSSFSACGLRAHQVHQYRAAYAIASCILFEVFHNNFIPFLSTILLVVSYEFILYSTIYSCPDYSQFLIEIQTTVSASP